MEIQLKELFDYQRFEGNKSLEKLISETENRYAKSLSDEELFFVNAAGEADVNSGAIDSNNRLG